MKHKRVGGENHLKGKGLSGKSNYAGVIGGKLKYCNGPSHQKVVIRMFNGLM